MTAPVVENRPDISAPDISWIIPLYHDRDHLETIVTKSRSFLQALQAPFEMILVNDGSTDDTGERAEALRQRYPEIRVVHHETNQGYGAAIARGFQTARARRFCGYTDGDAQYDPADFLDACRDVMGRRVPIAVIGYKTRRQDGRWRRFQSRCYNTLTAKLCGVSARDINCSLKFLPVTALSSAPLRSASAFIDAEILLRLRYRCVQCRQVPVRHFARGGGKTSVDKGFGARPKVIWHTLKDMAYYLLRRRAFLGF